MNIFEELKGSAALAPMAGVADCAFRELCREYGASYTVSEMVSSKGISYNSKKSSELMELSDKERPSGIQIFGDDALAMANAGDFAMQFSPQFIDINMGCPAPKISGNGAGASLMKKPKLVEEIITAVVKAVPVPVSVKIRKGWDDTMVNAVEIAKIAESCGASAVAVHGRTRQQYYKPPVDIDIIRAVKESVSIPVIGNGDIVSPKSAREMFNKTNCDLIFVGRGALGNPWIFREINEYLKTGKIIAPPSADEKLKVMTYHIENICEKKGEKYGMPQARKHIAWYLKGFHGAANFRNEAGRISTLSELYELVEKVRKSLQTVEN